MSEVDIHDFVASTVKADTHEEAGFSPAALQAFNYVLDLLKRKQIPPKKLRELMIAISSQEEELDPSDEEAYDETFDMEREVAEVLRSVKILRKSILTPSGRGLRAGVTVAEAKDVISMSNSMINTLMKSHEKIVNMARYRAVEQATVDVLRDLDGDEKLIQDLEIFQAGGKKGDGPLVTAFIHSLEMRLEG